MLTLRHAAWILMALLWSNSMIATALGQPPAWKPVEGRLMTRWAKEVTPDRPWPEYPRPTLVRERWQNLNGLWSYAFTSEGSERAKAEAGRILVPFPPESSLSGVGQVLQPGQTLWYWRTFGVPADWKGERVVLHFGAVDWHASVTVNGRPVGEHKGGYDPFSFDITEALRDGENELVVSVKDGTDTSGQPRGKQWLKPHGIWYTPTSGIWQTVWMEPVPKVSVLGVTLHPTLREKSVRVETKRPLAAGHTLRVKLLEGAKVVADQAFDAAAGAGMVLDVPDVKAWSPDRPFLYGVELLLSDAQGQSVDRATSYCAFREIRVARDGSGLNRLMLNGAPLFHFGPLDQGFWPDGLYTPPTDEAMKFDVQAVKDMGGNMLRKHVKVESERFYYWCDALGVMVWQDMPSPFFTDGKGENPHHNPVLSDEWKLNFESEWKAIVSSRGVHPSIVMWVPFNEGWGQNDLEWCASMVRKTKEWDPSRLVNNASGWTDMGVGDVNDVHVYPGPGMGAVESSRASVLGEFGGLGLPMEGHTWLEKNNWGYVSYKNKEELTNAYVDLLQRMPPLIADGLCAAVYTQTTDVEIEVNGWLTYDRAVWKVDPQKAAAAAKPLYLPPPRLEVVLARAGQGEPATWRFTTARPAADWSDPSFDDRSWASGPAGFGTKGTPGARVGTDWSGPEIWLRRTFDLAHVPAGELALSIHHDEDAEVYLNGVQVAALKGYTTSYTLAILDAKARAALKVGPNTLAVRCRQTGGGQYIDCGLVRVAPVDPNR